VKTTFDLPDRLLRRAKSLAAKQGRPLRELVAEAIDDKIAVEPSEVTDRPDAAESRRAAWDTWRSRLEPDGDGGWRNPEGISDEEFFERLERMRSEPWSRGERFEGVE